MNRLISKALLVLAVFGSTTALAQQGPTALPVQVDVDHATFLYSGQNTLLEMYMAFGASSLDYQQREGKFRARLPVQLSLKRSTEETLEDTPTNPVWSDTTTFRFALEDTTNLTAGQHFIQQVRRTVAPGEYELQLTIPESADGTRKPLMLRRDIKVPGYQGQEDVALSDLVLASSIKRSKNTESPFYKNGLVIRPNANQLYGQGLSNLFYYAEAYNPHHVAGGNNEYTVYAYVSQAGELEPVQELRKRYQREARSPDVLVGSFNVAKLPSGSYFLRLAVLNENNEAVAQQARKFFVFNPRVEREQATALNMSYESSPFAEMPEEEVETELEQIRYIANSREERRIGNLDSLEAKRRYLLRFWQQRDPNPSTATNEQRRRFKQQVLYANERYGTNFSEGWETDRGRVLLTYGRPSAIDPSLYESDTVPHEIWTYDNIPGEGQSRFVFADRQGFGRFELVHSDVAGEISLPNWENRLSRR